MLSEILGWVLFAVILFAGVTVTFWFAYDLWERIHD